MAWLCWGATEGAIDELEGGWASLGARDPPDMRKAGLEPGLFV